MYNTYSTELCHHGILGQRWGVRRFQNPDGSVTAAGAKRYQTGDGKKTKYTNGMSYGKMKKAIEQDKEKMARDYWKSKEAIKIEDEIDKANKRMEHLADKYHLDPDDGGGHDGSSKTRKASKEYANLLEKTMYLDLDLRDGQDRYVKNKLTEKYGKEHLDNFYKSKGRRGKAVASAIILGIGGTLVYKNL